MSKTENLASNNLGLDRSLGTSNMKWPPDRLPFTRQEAQVINEAILNW
jgi:hypothetical protein